MSISSEHYAKATVRVAGAETLLATVADADPAAEAQTLATIALTHALMADTADRGYSAERLIHVIEKLTAAIRVSGS